MIIDTSKSPYAKVYSVAQENVDWDGGFWRERFDVAADSTVPHIRAMFEDKDPWFHVVENFRVAAGIAEGDHEGTPFGDGDFYKWLEAATYVVAKRRDKKLEEELDDYIELIGKCQQPDGYISTKQIIADRKRTDGDSSRLGDINDFECYNFGHLFTAACTYKRVTGKDAFLKIAIKAAGYLRTMYQGFLDAGEAKTEVCPSHYMGLVELYRTTGDKEFLEIAKMAVAVRDLVKDGSFDNQDATPLRSHKKIMGHCVRSTYLYAGVADLYAETGDEEYRAMLDRVWKNGFMQKTYLNGGNAALYTGNSPYGLFPYLNGAKVSFVHQAYGYEYQLPNITAYNETCGALGSIMWNLRMFSLDPKAKYFDLIERTMLNLTIASVSLDGDKYFYENMLRRTEELDYEVIWPRTRVNTMSCFINIIFLIIGMFMDSNVAIMIFTPILLPSLIAMGIDPIHFGVVICLNVVIGIFTPPFGTALFLGQAVTGLSFARIVKAMVPYFVPLLLGLLLITAFPWISTLIPNMMFG